MKKRYGVLVAFVLALAMVLSVAGCGKKTEGPPTGGNTPLSDEDRYILSMQHRATIDENFCDNQVGCLFKTAFDDLEEVEFSEFSSVDKISKVVSITYGSGTYSRGETIPMDPTDENKRFVLELNDHSKEKVLQVIEELEKLDKVLCAYVRYLGDGSVDDWVPSDPYYEDQWGLSETASGAIHMQQAWDITRGELDGTTIRS